MGNQFVFYNNNLVGRVCVSATTENRIFFKRHMCCAFDVYSKDLIQTQINHQQLKNKKSKPMIIYPNQTSVQIGRKYH